MKKRGNPKRVLAVLCAVAMVVTMFPTSLMFGGISFAEDGPATEVTEPADGTAKKGEENTQAQDGKEVTEPEQKDKEVTEPEKKADETAGSESPSEKIGTDAVEEKKPEVSDDKKADDKNGEKTETGTEEKKDDKDGNKDEKKAEGYKVEFDFGENYARFNPINPKTTDKEGKIELPEKPKARDKVYKAEDGKEYYFTGWEYKDDEYEPGDTVTLKDDAKFKAVWKQTYTIEFSAKGIEADEVDPQTEVFGENVVLPEETASEDGLDFVGWTPDNGKTVYAAGETIPAKSIQPVSRSAAKNVIKLKANNEDNTPPEISISIKSTDLANNKAVFKVSATDASDVDKLTYNVSTTQLSPTDSDGLSWSSVNSGEVTVNVDATSKIAYLYVFATDKLYDSSEDEEKENHRTLAEREVDLNQAETVAPVVSIKDDADYQGRTTAKKSHKINFSVTDASEITEINVFVGGDTAPAYTLAGTATSVDVSQDASGKALTGDKSIIIKATDKWGNTGESSPVTYKFDNEAPTIQELSMPEVTAPAVAGFYNASNAKVTVKVASISDVDTVKINGVDAKESAEGSGIWTADLSDLDEKEIEIKVATKDVLGNENDNCTLPEGAITSFVLDKTAPKLVKVVTAPGQTGGPLNNNYYYGTAAVSTYTIDDLNPNTLELKYKQDDGTGPEERSGVISEDKLTATGDWSVATGKDLAYISDIKLSGADKAGNLLVAADSPDVKAEDTINAEAVSGGVVPFTYGKVVDTKTPSVSIEFSTKKEPEGEKPKVYLYDEEGKIKGYVSGAVEAAITIIDNEPLRFSSIQVTTDDGLVPISNLVSGDAKKFELSNIPIMKQVDGSYQYIIYGMDFAKHELETEEKVLDGVPVSATSTSFENSGIKDKDAAEANLVTFVRDTLAPNYTTTFTPDIDPTENVDSDDIAYYNKDFTAQIDIAEENIDTERLKAYVQSNTSPDVEYYNTAVLGDQTYIAFDAENKQFKNKYATDGVYKFCVYGEDKAGNMLVKSESEAAKTDYTRSVKDELTDGKYWSMKKVRDIIPPDASVSIDDFLKFTLKGTDEHTQEKYEPFQKNKTSATIKITQEDKSPVKIYYKVPWKKPDGSDTNPKPLEVAYKNNASDEHVMTAEKGKGIQFAVSELKLTDRAGNVTKFGDDGLNKGYNVYLDNAVPKSSEGVDAVRPFTSIKATSSVTKRTVKGQDLYSNNVKVKFTVVDPNANKSSSGLKKVNYEIIVNGKKIDSGRLKDLVGEDEMLLEERSDKTEKQAGQTGEGLRFTCEKQIELKCYRKSKDETFETNNILVNLYAVDNAGNDNSASTRFGIDSVGPKVKVTYNNNSAQNKKYFKANRTATVTVTERNLGTGSDKIKIKTQVNVPSNWTYKAGSVPGNDDQWTKYLNYNKDGDYTLGVSGTDALGNAADITYEGTAPRDFVIDKTRPIIRVTFDNNNVRNKKYYKANRTATVRITEHNFAVKDYKVAGKAVGPRKTGLAFPSTGRFSSNGDVRTAAIPFTKEGSYNFKVDYTDLAGNKAKTIVVEEFVIDKTAPVVKIENVINGGIYGGTVAPRAVFDDDTFNRNESTFRFTGVRQVDRSALVPGFRANGEYGGSYVMSDFPHIRANDDIYTAYATSTDMAGNTTTVQVVFSVNRFGSTYDYNGDEATISLVSKETGRYYTNKATPLVIREINVNPLKSYELTLDRGGNTVKLKEGTDYTVAKSSTDQGTVYVYKIKDSIVTDEGSYNIVVKSTDEAGNINTNAAIRSEKDSTEVPLRFVYDTTAPTMSFTNIGDGDKTIELRTTGSSRFSGIDLLDLGIVPEDDWSLGSIQYVLSGRDGVVFDSGVIKGDEFWKVMGEDGLKRFEQEIQHGSDVKTLDVTVWDAAGNKTAQSYKILVTKNALEVAAHYWYIVLLILAALGGGYAYYRKRKQDSEESEEAA